ncbi:ROK family protein [Hephaestia mangrovi]|uniref:ROK family protein n=1 Tax=Hephaestia mangrovi TaxID=2873268 RepID=UPI0034E28A8B
MSQSARASAWESSPMAGRSPDGCIQKPAISASGDRSGTHSPGSAPFHGDCLEGLASGPAIAARAGAPAETLSPNDPVWAPVADALAEAMANLLLTLSCERIVIGGGVGVGQPHLFDKIRAGTVAKLAGYLPGMDRHAVARTIVPAALSSDAGPLGALLLADQHPSNRR